MSYDAFAEPRTHLERFVPLGQRLAERGGATIVANPSANPWPWPEHAAQWERAGLRATLASAKVAEHGVTAHLVGRILDLEFQGMSEIVTPHGVLARATSYDRGESVLAFVTC
jgi:predicted amidohydrolase